MNKHWMKENAAKQKAFIKDLAAKMQCIIEVEDAIAFKFLAAEKYDAEDIAKCAERMLATFKHDYSRQFVLVREMPLFDQVFKKVNVEVDKPHFSIIAKSKFRWVVLCILKQRIETEEEIAVFYKEPGVQEMPDSFQKSLKKKFTKFTLIRNENADKNYTYEAAYGPLALRNLLILLKFLARKASSILFSRTELFKVQGLRRERLRLSVFIIERLSKDAAFKRAFINFLNNLPFELNLAVREYHKVLDRELGGERADHERIATARNTFLTNENLNKLEGDYKVRHVEGQEGYVLEIEQKFPNQMKQITSVFKLFENVNVGEALSKCMDMLCLKLELNRETFEKLYQLRGAQKTKETKHATDHSGDSVKNIASSLPQMKEIIECPKGPSLIQILNRLDYVKASGVIPDAEEAAASDDSDRDELAEPYREMKETLMQNYNVIQDRYEESKGKTIETINKWAQEKKKDGLKFVDDNVYEAVAIMDRAFGLLTGGFRLSRSQMLSIIVLHNRSNRKSRFCEIQPGEGKTMIIAVLAALQSLRGRKVDVVTSSLELARRSVAATKQFFAVFDLTVSTNHPHDAVGYSADVVYGTLDNFQMEYLKNVYEDKAPTKNIVIVDEIDCLLLDNGEHIARLSRTYPGMDFFRYIYIRIWEELHKAEESFAEDFNNNVKQKLAKLSDEEARYEVEKYFEILVVDERSTLKDKIRNSNPIDFDLIPVEWRAFVEAQLDKWLKSALHAKYNCHEHRHYRIIRTESGERKIVPIKRLNASLTLRNTIWTNGLYQFVQLKHNLSVSNEKLPSCLISNVAYVHARDSYEDVFGLIGAFGSVQELEHLAEIYKLEYIRVPSDTKRKFQELAGEIYDGDTWPSKVTLKIAAEADAGRTVLAIFESEEDVLLVEMKLGCLRESAFTIRTCVEDENVQAEFKAKSGLIILATYSAALCVDLKVGEDVASKGGVHVCVCFLPSSPRVERLAFGRTARGGNSGTAQLLIRQTDLLPMGLGGELVDFELVKKKRDEAERCRLRYMRDVVWKEMQFLDKLYGKFINMCNKLVHQATTQRYRLAALDFQEFWAFWLANKKFRVSTIIDTTPNEEYDKFVHEATDIIFGKICHNPYYCVSLGDFYLRNDSIEKARPILKYAVKVAGGKNDEILSGAHMKIFEAHIKCGQHILEKLRKVTQDVIPIEYEKFDDYKKYARKQLAKAQIAVKSEIDYVEKLMSVKNPNFVRILHCEDVENALVKQICTKLFCLKFHESNIEYLMETLNDKKGDLHLDGKSDFTLANLMQATTEQEKLQNLISEQVLLELRSSGINVIYSLNEVHDVPDSISESIRKRLRLGMAALAVAMSFPAAFALMTPMAITLISDGIVDAVMEIIGKSESHSEDKDYAKLRLIKSSYLITLRATPLRQVVNLVKRSVNVCQELSSFMRSATRFRAICNRLVNSVDRLQNVWAKKVAYLEFLKLDESAQRNQLLNMKHTGNTETFNRLGGEAKLQELEGRRNLGILDSGIKSFQDTAKMLWKNNKDLYNSLTTQITSASTTEQPLREILSGFFQTLKEGIRMNAALLLKLHTTTTERIFKALDGLTRKEQFVAVKKLLAEQIVDYLTSTELGKRFTAAEDFVKRTPELDEFFGEFAARLERKLEGGAAKNNVEKVVAQICAKLEEQVLAWARIILKGTQKIVGIGKTLSKFSCGCTDPYATLRVTKKDGLKVVKGAYREKCLALAEDASKSAEQKEKEFLRVQKAYISIVKRLPADK